LADVRHNGVHVYLSLGRHDSAGEILERKSEGAFNEPGNISKIINPERADALAAA
jgi:hypothetical protein